jgi:hypothetical protein
MVWYPGFMRVFFKKMGIENVRFKPAYNPYTEVRSSLPWVLISRHLHTSAVPGNLRLPPHA